MTCVYGFYGYIHSPACFWSPHIAAEVETCAIDFPDCYSWLTVYSIERGHMKWQLTIKFHYLKHGANLAQFLNPKFGSTYTAESFVGKVCKRSAFLVFRQAIAHDWPPLNEKVTDGRSGGQAPGAVDERFENHQKKKLPTCDGICSRHGGEG